MLPLGRAPRIGARGVERAPGALVGAGLGIGGGIVSGATALLEQVERAAVVTRAGRSVPVRLCVDIPQLAERGCTTSAAVRAEMRARGWSPGGRADRTGSEWWTVPMAHCW